MKTVVLITLLVCLWPTFSSSKSVRVKCFYCNVDGEEHDDRNCGGLDNLQDISDIDRCQWNTLLESSIKIKYERNSEMGIFPKGCFCKSV